LRVDDDGERLDAVDQPRAGADHDAVGVDGPDRHPGQRAGRHQRLLGRAGQVIPVDVTRGHGAGIQAADHDRLLRAGGRRLVALEGDPGQVIAQPERVDDLRRRRQQRDQAHRSRLIRRRRGSRSSSRT
jgi:hypothetical protein